MRGMRAAILDGRVVRTGVKSMKVMRLNGEPPTIDAVAEEVDAGSLAWSKSNGNGEIASFGARLSQLLAQETPHDLLGRLAEFKQSVEDALRRSSSAYQILRQLEESGLKDCARCTREMETSLAGNPHYVVLRKIAEAEKAVSELTLARR
jgi:hypothetical protein